MNVLQLKMDEADPMRLKAGMLFTLLTVCVCNILRAEIVGTESFNYPSDTELRLQGTENNGFLRPWAGGAFNADIVDDLTVTSGSLSYGSFLTSGNRVQGSSQTGIAGLRRPFDNMIGGNNETVYMSFLIRPESDYGDGAFNNFFGLTLESNLEADPELFIGRPGTADVWGLEQRGGGGAASSDFAPVVGETSLLVLKAEFGANVDTFTLFVNPELNGLEPSEGISTSEVNLTEVSGIGLYYTGGFSFDEFRMGTTYASVTAVPEPTSLALLVSGAVCIVSRRVLKRRHST